MCWRTDVEVMEIPRPNNCTPKKRHARRPKTPIDVSLLRRSKRLNPDLMNVAPPALAEVQVQSEVVEMPRLFMGAAASSAAPPPHFPAC